LSVPAAGGSGDAVETLDYDRNGTADFVVLNGNLSTPGPGPRRSLDMSGW
jgi:hypothetical protein